MMTIKRLALSCGMTFVAHIGLLARAEPPEVRLGGQHQEFREWADKWDVQFAKQPEFEQVRRLLAGSDSQTTLSRNWIGMLASGALVSQQANASVVSDAKGYVVERSEDKHGRTVVLRWLQRVEPEFYEEVLDGAIDDPSLPIRQLAIAKFLRRDDLENEELKSVLTLARHPSHIQRITSRLKDAGEEVSLAGAFAMIPKFAVIGPFDNRDGIGFDAVTDVETSTIPLGRQWIDSTKSTFEGKNGAVSWQEVESNDETGFVELADHFEKEKGATAYAAVVVVSDADQKVQLRLQSPNANRVWLNGVEVQSNEIYHAGTMLDQYSQTVTLRRGKNIVLLKILQNEQTQPWAQDWQFRLRVTDLNGKPLRLATEIPPIDQEQRG